MNLKLDLKFDPQKILGLLRRFGPSLVGLALVGVFGYTGWVINQAFNVKPAETTAVTPRAKVNFDKPTLELIKNIRVVPGEVPPVDLGKSDPFGN